MAFFLIFLATLILIAIFVIIRIYYGFKPPLNIESGTPADFDLDYNQFWIPTTNNKKLFSWYMPTTSSAILTREQYDAPTLIMVHGWGGNAEFALPLALPFKDKNINILVFDHRNHGKSDKRVITTVASISEDVGAAIDWVKAQNKDTPIILMGHSIGAAAALHQSSLREDVDAVISLSTFAHIRSIVANILRSFGVFKAYIPTTIKIIEKIIGHSLDDIAPVKTLTQQSCPVMLIHGNDDNTIGYQNFEELCKIASTKSLPDIRCLPLEGGQHFPVVEVTTHSDQIINFLESYSLL